MMELSRPRLIALLALSLLLLAARTARAAVATPAATVTTPATVFAPGDDGPDRFAAADDGDFDDALGDLDFDLDDDCLLARAQTLPPPAVSPLTTRQEALQPAARPPRQLFRPPRRSSV